MYYCDLFFFKFNLHGMPYIGSFWSCNQLMSLLNAVEWKFQFKMIEIKMHVSGKQSIELKIFNSWHQVQSRFKAYWFFWRLVCRPLPWCLGKSRRFCSGFTVFMLNSMNYIHNTVYLVFFARIVLYLESKPFPCRP